MKGNQKSNKAVMCPFYRKEDPSALICAGVPRCQSVKINFVTAKDKQDYCQEFCCGKFQNCPFFDCYRPPYGIEDEFSRFDPLYGGIRVRGDETMHIFKPKKKDGSGEPAREDTKVLLADSENERERTGDGQEAHGAADL